MNDRLKFDESTVSDQKRLVRGEQLQFARSRLRVRDGVHHRPWRILILAGGAPKGEVNTIREVMPKAYIVAVDRDSRCLDAAIEAGVDDIILCDLADFTIPLTKSGKPSAKRYPSAPLRELSGQFDIVHLDLCAGVNSQTRLVTSVNSQLVSPRGVLIVTFSFGRDVVEIFREPANQSRAPKWLSLAGADPTLCGRIGYLFGFPYMPGIKHPPPDRIRSVFVYRGAEMPMCSVLLQGCREWGVEEGGSFVKVEPGDFELAVTCPDPSRLYDCPQERIESLRRQHAAMKAVYTRRSAPKAVSPATIASESQGRLM